MIYSQRDFIECVSIMRLYAFSALDNRSLDPCNWIEILDLYAKTFGHSKCDIHRMSIKTKKKNMQWECSVQADYRVSCLFSKL